MNSTYTYVAPQYEPASEVVSLQNVPRWGRSSNFSDLTGSESEREDYIRGLTLVSGLLFAFFALWSVLLVLWKFMGLEHVGFLSGQPMEASYYGKVYDKRPRRVRITFIICGFTVILCSFLLVRYDVSDVSFTFDTLRSVNEEIRTVLEDGEKLTVALEDVGFRAVILFNQVGFASLSRSLQNALEFTGADIGDLVDIATDQFQKIQGFLNSNLPKLKGLVQNMLDFTDDADNFLDNAAKSSVILDMWYVIPIMLTTTALILGAMGSSVGCSPGCSEKFLGRFILPLFTVLVTITWLCTCALSSLALLNADFCSGDDGDGVGSPDGTILSVIESEREDGLTDEELAADDNLQTRTLKYYVSGCSTDDPFGFVRRFDENVHEAMMTISVIVLNLAQPGASTLSAILGTDVTPTINAIGRTQKSLSLLGQDADLTLDLVSCERLNSIYVTAFHDGTCDQMIGAVTSMFAIILVMSVAGMTMLTLRSALYRSET